MADVTMKSNVQKVMAELKDKKAIALETIGGMAETYAKQLCPVDTGRLRNSISHAQMDENTEIIGTNVYYAPYVELGVRNRKAKPFLRPAAEGHKQEYKEVFERVLKKG